MRAHWLFVGLASAAATSAPAGACRLRAQTVLADVRYADVVVVGRVVNYTIIRDREFRRRMSQTPNLPNELRKAYADPESNLIGDYARFDVRVEQVLAGRPAKRLRVAWSNSTFGLPKSLPDGPVLIALSKPGAISPPLRGPSATFVPSREPGLRAVVQAPCASPLMFAATSPEARAIRRILRTQRSR
jgi:hypothetical protein